MHAKNELCSSRLSKVRALQTKVIEMCQHIPVRTVTVFIGTTKQTTVIMRRHRPMKYTWFPLRAIVVCVTWTVTNEAQHSKDISEGWRLHCWFNNAVSQVSIENLRAAINFSTQDVCCVRQGVRPAWNKIKTTQCAKFRLSVSRFLVRPKRSCLHVLTFSYESPLPSNRQHLSYDVCLQVRGEIIRTVLCCIVYWSCAQS